MGASAGNFGFSELCKLFAQTQSHIEESFVIENGDPDLTAQDILGKSRPDGDWYASFIFQDENSLQGLLSSLPLTAPSFFADGVSHSECVWMFFGTNVSFALNVNLVSCYPRTKFGKSDARTNRAHRPRQQ